MSNPRYYDASPEFVAGAISVQRERTKRNKVRWRVSTPRAGNVHLTRDQLEDLADAVDEAIAWDEEHEIVEVGLDT